MRKSMIQDLQKGKMPPQAVDLEEVLIGALLIDTTAADEVFEIIRAPEVFYKSQHQLIVGAMMELHRDQHPIDLLTVSDKLKQKKQLEQSGGDYFLIGLTQKVASSAHAEYHARIVMQMYLKRRIIGFNNQVIQLAYDHGTDVFEILDQYQRETDKVIDIIQTGRRSISFAQSLDVVRADAVRLSERTDDVKIVGAHTGFLQMDRHTGGYRNGDFIVLAARPGMGKTAKVLKTVSENLKQGNPVGMISLEMSIHQLTARMVSINSNLHLTQILRDGFTKMRYLQSYDAAANELKNYGFYVDDSGVSDITEIIIRARAWKRMFGIKLLVVDYLQLMDDTNIKAGINREAIISSCSRKLKLLAKQLEIPVIALSQLSREVEKRQSKRPQLSDLRESGAIEQDADMVEFLYRPEYYNVSVDVNDYSNETHHELIMNHGANTEVLIEKFRGGSRAMIMLKWIGDKTKFIDPADGVERQAEADESPF